MIAGDRNEPSRKRGERSRGPSRPGAGDPLASDQSNAVNMLRRDSDQISHPIRHLRRYDGLAATYQRCDGCSLHFHSSRFVFSRLRLLGLIVGRDCWAADCRRCNVAIGCSLHFHSSHCTSSIMIVGCDSWAADCQRCNVAIGRNRSLHSTTPSTVSLLGYDGSSCSDLHSFLKLAFV
jgi:hypothetical protein